MHRSFDLVEFYMNTLLPNQEPVIIGSNNITQEEALGSGHFGSVFKGAWQRMMPDGKPVCSFCTICMYETIKIDLGCYKGYFNYLV